MAAGQARLTEGWTSFLTYGFSDSDPVANPSLRQYPYFRFDGYEAVGQEREWKTVTLENEWIQVTVFPEIGGKVWGAVDKTTGKEFIYYNHVVKFRDIAMRGAWTSGGIEFNFGLIGHAPTSATPVDYLTRKNPDGSVSCLIASFELLTRTWWTIEINVPADEARFYTKTNYINTSSLTQPYYNWSNAAFKAGGNLQLCYPGDRYITHSGDPFPYPVDAEGRDLSWFSNNAFGKDKSYHIIGEYAEFFGAYWHDDAFGYAHVSRPDEKLGRKFFCWSQARQGGIWEDLLTDADGQYVEMQAGRMFNQPKVVESIGTPFKHNAIAPGSHDSWDESWFPVGSIGAFQAAGRLGALTLERQAGGRAQVRISPVVGGNHRVQISCGNGEIFSEPVEFTVLQPWSLDLVGVGDGPVRIVVGEDELVYDEDPAARETHRPDTMPADFDWKSAHGHGLRAEQLLNVQLYEAAEKEFAASLEQDPWYTPSLHGLAALYLHGGRYAEAFELTRKALQLNTYDGEANYLYGLAARALGKKVEEKDGFSLATYSSAWKDAAYLELGRTALAEQKWNLALTYAHKSRGPMARVVGLAALRHLGQREDAERQVRALLGDLPLFPFFQVEQSLLAGDAAAFREGLRCELPQETLLETALWYLESGLDDDATLLCRQDDYPSLRYLQAYLLDRRGEHAASDAMLDSANASSPAFVFPFRPEMLKVFDFAASQRPDWKLDYYRALIRWKAGDPEAALAGLNACSDTPDYAPFYLTRAKLRNGDERLVDLRRAETLSEDWRTGLSLVDYYSQASDWDEACTTGARYFRKLPDKFELGLAYADALCGAGRYAQSLKVLSKLQVMPKEGAHRGHQIYRAACLGKAKEELRAGKYAACIRSVEASKIWEERLGVGKPYDELIDYSEEDAILRAARERNRNAF